jgi:hypothetical protein
MSEQSFYESAKTFSRNPLGIIALFLVLVYAVASIVISLAKPEFYQNPYHPAVLFLAFFPLAVLLVFAYLVARHHRNLYAPQDYKHPSDFFFGLKAPQALGTAPTAAATSDSTTSVLKETAQTLEARYTELVADAFVLLHHAEVLQQRTSPGSGRYRVRVWVESIDSTRPISDIDQVTYHVWRDFQNPVLSTSDSKSNFDLWLNVYGEFPVLAIIRTKSGDSIEVQRYLDLPGRPPD